MLVQGKLEDCLTVRRSSLSAACCRIINLFAGLKDLLDTTISTWRNPK